MYLIKHCVDIFTAPLSLAAVLAVSAAVLRLLGGRRIVTVWMLALAASIAYLGATGLVGNALIRPLERRYSPLADGAIPSVGFVVVLGSGYSPRYGIPVTAALDEDGLVRIVEGVRIQRLMGRARLVVSGGAPEGESPPAAGMAKLARDLGVNDASLIVLDSSLNTNVEARSVAILVGAVPFVLVTSAYHMPRALRAMERAGVRPIPAPTGQRSDAFGWRNFVPTSNGLGNTERALHEYLGMAALAANIER
jgi:uncharacterized SAM-binding protein YcdF (DUF218 family)